MSDTLELVESTGLLARSRLVAFVELGKPRIAAMVLVATAAGFMLAWPRTEGPLSVSLLLHTLWGTALSAAGANGFNQYLEARYDRLMVRTKGRPLPTGRLTPAEVVTVSLAVSTLGVVHLVFFASVLAGVVAAVAVLSYTLLYTPFKRVNPGSVFFGAFSGALPPLIGWSAARPLTAVAAVPFVILFFWQLPHFAAIAWLYREDYRKAGFPMLPVVDPQGGKTSRHMLTQSVSLLAASLLPSVYGLTGTCYSIAAALLGIGFLACGIAFVVHKTDGMARVHLMASVVYLPLLFACMIIDKAPLA